MARWSIQFWSTCQRGSRLHILRQHGLLSLLWLWKRGNLTLLHSNLRHVFSAQMVLLCFREESKEKTSPIQNSKKTKLPLPRLACTSSKKFYACQTFDTGLKEANFRAPEHPIIPGKARTPHVPCLRPKWVGLSPYLPCPLQRSPSEVA